MNNNLLDFIQSLTELDKKNLLEKVGKLFEEGGELSKKALPYFNSHGTLHRMVKKEDILEEVSDTILVALSIAYDLGFEHKDIEEMLMKKSKVWADIQKREARMKDKIPYEIHITVEEACQEKFISVCKNLEVKPIILDLQLKEKVVKDVMTSSVIIGNNTEAINEMKRISNGLKEEGFVVLREKIETVPWHTAAPSREFNNLEMPKDCYFESHFGIKILDEKEQLSSLKSICEKHNCHLSKNFFKQNIDGSYTIMATYRSYVDVYEDFEESIKNIENDLVNNKFNVDKVIVEFSIYDSKITHDSDWLSSSS